jgi:hypothetical protein
VDELLRWLPRAPAVGPSDAAICEDVARLLTLYWRPGPGEAPALTPLGSDAKSDDSSNTVGLSMDEPDVGEVDNPSAGGVGASPASSVDFDNLGDSNEDAP